MGANNGGGNPYRDPNTGRYVNSLGEIANYKSLSNEEIQIQRNVEESEKASGILNLNSNMYRSANETSNSVESLLKSGYELKDFDINDINSVMSTTCKVYMDATGRNMIPACYNSAATLSTILKSKGIPHSVMLGLGSNSQDDININIGQSFHGNHVWVKIGHNIYDTFGNSLLKDSIKPKYYQEVREFRF